MSAKTGMSKANARQSSRRKGKGHYLIYRNECRRDKRKMQRMKRHIERHPGDGVTVASIAACEKRLRTHSNYR